MMKLVLEGMYYYIDGDSMYPEEIYWESILEFETADAANDYLNGDGLFLHDFNGKKVRITIEEIE